MGEGITQAAGPEEMAREIVEEFYRLRNEGLDGSVDDVIAIKPKQIALITVAIAAQRERECLSCIAFQEECDKLTADLARERANLHWHSLQRQELQIQLERERAERGEIERHARSCIADALVYRGGPVPLGHFEQLAALLAPPETPGEGT